MFGAFFRRLLYGRYGYDVLNRTLTITALVLLLPGFIFRGNHWLVGVCTLAAYVSLIFAMWRTFSRNFAARQRELAAYYRFCQAVGRHTFRLRRRGYLVVLRLRRSLDRQYKYLKCPDCQAVLRVPRGKGKIKITCKKCGHVFKAKS